MTGARVGLAVAVAGEGAVVKLLVVVSSIELAMTGAGVVDGETVHSGSKKSAKKENNEWNVDISTRTSMCVRLET